MYLLYRRVSMDSVGPYPGLGTGERGGLHACTAQFVGDDDSGYGLSRAHQHVALARVGRKVCHEVEEGVGRIRFGCPSHRRDHQHRCVSGLDGIKHAASDC